jgi:nicotinamide riboside kinase
MRMEPISIVILGPESSGKTHLVKALAAHYQTAWVPEEARGYLNNNGNHYTKEDLKKIAEGQIREEEQVREKWQEHWKQATSRPFVFLDTDLQVIRVWSEWVFGHCDSTLLKMLATQTHHGYLLCEPDLPWETDPLRSNPDLGERTAIYHHYREMLIDLGKPWASISGSGPVRLERALEALKGFEVRV